MFLRLTLCVACPALLVLLMTKASSSAPPSPGVLIVANQKEHTVLLVDPEARRELAKITVGVNGHEVAVSPDSRFAYVPIYGNSGVGRPGTDGATIDIIDLQQRKLAATMDLGKPLRPHQPQFGPDGLLYVSAELANAVDIIDPSSRKVLAEAPTGQPESHMFVLSKDGHRAYTYNVHAGTVSVVDIANRKSIPAHLHLSRRRSRLHPRSRRSSHRRHRHCHQQNHPMDRHPRLRLRLR